MSAKLLTVTRFALARLLGLPRGALVLRVHDRPHLGLTQIVVGAAGLPPNWQPPTDVQEELALVPYTAPICPSCGSALTARAGASCRCLDCGDAFHA